MKTPYNGSERHKANVRAARIISRIPIKCEYCNRIYTVGGIKNHTKSCLSNPLNIVECKQCLTQIFNKGNIFCGRSCAASYNMLRRNSEIRNRQYKTLSATMTGRISSQKGILKGVTMETRFCPTCKAEFSAIKWRKTKFCSTKCLHYDRAMRAHKWGKCLSIEYHCKTTNDTVILQSTWEKRVAERLDELSIEWTRPEPIPWIDKKGKSHFYFPDFYLPKSDVYLDPKNPRVMVKDIDKIEKVSKQINLVVGDLANIFSIIETLTEKY